MKYLAGLAGLMISSQLMAQAAPSQPATQPVSPVCATMPERLGHFWSQSDWCRWLQEFENNRERSERPKPNGR